MHQASCTEPLPGSKSRSASPRNDDASTIYGSQDDRLTRQCQDFDQQYIMLDDGNFVRVNHSFGSAEKEQKETSSIRIPSIKATTCPDSPLDPTPVTSPRLLIVPEYNMAVNSISCAFSVGGRSFLVSPTCVDSEDSLLSFLDGNVALSNDNDGDLMLWCSWFVILFEAFACSMTQHMFLRFFESSSAHSCLRCMRCSPQIKDVPSSVSFGRTARRCSNCRRATVQVCFDACCLPCFVMFS
jgi:hypothetical protein